MIEAKSEITTLNGQTFKLYQNLTCENCGIYAAQYQLCHHLYVGQTINRFSTRWSAHRSTWKAGYTRVGSEDKAVLLYHHLEFLNQNPNITECYKVAFQRNLKITNILTYTKQMKANGLVNYKQKST